MVQHERICLLNELLADGKNVVVDEGKNSFSIVNNGTAIFSLLPIKGMSLIGEVLPVKQVKKMVTVGINTPLAVNTRYSFQVSNDSATYYSHSAAVKTYAGTTPFTGNQAALASSLYSDLVRKVNLDALAYVSAALAYKVTVAHNAAVALAVDSVVTQAGNAGFVGKVISGSLVNGTSTVYISCVGTLDTAKAVTFGANTTSGAAPSIEVAGVVCEDIADYSSTAVQNKYQMGPSAVTSGSLSVSTVKEGIISRGQGIDMIRDAQVFNPDKSDLIYGSSILSLTGVPDPTKTYSLISFKVLADTPEGEMGDGAKPNISVCYKVYADFSDTTKLNAFKAKLTEASLLQ